MTIFHVATILGLLHYTVAVVIAVRVIMRRPNTGVALAWLILVTGLPFAGAAIYLLVGETRIGRTRGRRITDLRGDWDAMAAAAIDDDLTCADWGPTQEVAAGIDALGRRMVGVPTVTGSEGELFTSSETTLAQIAADIDSAEHCVLMEFYIWNAGGAADDVLNAVIKAARRGVACYVLIDDLGAHPWWKSDQPKRMTDAGVHVRRALPVGILRTLFGRNDLRLHRKVVAIDGRVAWTGSMNLVDPRFFKQDANVGQWVDAMVRTEGSVVAPLSMTMLSDWILETGDDLEQMVETARLRDVSPQGDGRVQVVPSGPGESGDGLLQMLLALINAARVELVLTTPYFAPDESLLRAIRGAAGRGVRVDLILPRRVDSTLTRYASRSYYDDLLDVGVNIHLYRSGLLHTKSITCDRQLSMFGSVNLDMRSIWINYEVAMFVYGTRFAEQLHALHETYLEDCDTLDRATWARRPVREQFVENTCRLFAPLL